MKKAPQNNPEGKNQTFDIINHYPDKSKHIKRLAAWIEAFFFAAFLILGMAAFIAIFEIWRCYYAG
jgi:hypothetical protein